MLNCWHPAVVNTRCGKKSASCKSWKCLVNESVLKVTIWNEAGKISALLDFGVGILGWTMGTLHYKICIKRCMFNNKDSKEPRLVHRMPMYKMQNNEK